MRFNWFWHPGTGPRRAHLPPRRPSRRSGAPCKMAKRQRGKLLAACGKQLARADVNQMCCGRKCAWQCAAKIASPSSVFCKRCTFVSESTSSSRSNWAEWAKRQRAALAAAESQDAGAEMDWEMESLSRRVAMISLEDPASFTDEYRNRWDWTVHPDGWAWWYCSYLGLWYLPPSE